MLKKEKIRREKIGKAFKKLWKNPQYLAKMEKRNKKLKILMRKDNPMKQKKLRINASKRLKGEWKNEEFRKKRLGKNHFNWKGGVSRTYSLRLKKEHFRDCPCFYCSKSKKLDIHHLDKNFHNNKLNNLMIVCRGCHNKLHSGNVEIPQNR